ncbi:GAF domain-containing protein [Streptomyces sp. A7024]|uniref:GAF domain-containing protein n=1 Tax=Streptomyces coryli TaxID=1128680 RepID=A0A6G4UD10_9ACTN|nr:GAF domain-containing protein [Streptomyces coryli]
MRNPPLDSARPPAGTDPRTYARLLAGVHDAVLEGERPPAPPRPVIAESWHRLMSHGLNADVGASAGLLPVDEVERERQSSGLSAVLDTLREGLLGIADAALQIMIVTDPHGHVLWRGGSRAVLNKAYGLGFVEGANWSEDHVGTNAIGTTLITGRPTQVHSAEHFVRTHHAWTCAGAPVHAARDGRLLGVVDVSGPAATVHPSTLGLVNAVAKLAESELRTEHAKDLDRLRAIAAPLLARLTGRAVVTDPYGWVAAVSGMPPADRILLPARVGEHGNWLPGLGQCTFEPLPGGWLIRPAETDVSLPTRVLLDVRRPRNASVTVIGASGTWTHELSPRHAELLLLLAAHPDGRSAAGLAADLFGDAERTVTVRAEVSRLRRRLGGVLQHRPYRFADGLEVEVARPADPTELLPHSSAPAVARMRWG